MPGRSRRSSVAGVVVRVARLHATTPRPAWGWHAFGARSHACSVVCAASSGERAIPTRHSMWLYDVRQRHRTACGTTSDVDRTSPAVAAAERMAFSVESETSS